MAQKDIVLKHLKNKGKIDQWEATRKYGITRLAALVHVLKNEGHKIKSELKHSPQGGNYAEYSI